MSDKCRNTLRRNCVLACFCKAVGNNFAVAEISTVEIVGKANKAERKAAGKGKAVDKDKTAGRTDTVADKDNDKAEHTAVDTALECKTAGRTAAAECIVDTIESTNKAERRSRFGTN